MMDLAERPAGTKTALQCMDYLLNQRVITAPALVILELQ